MTNPKEPTQHSVVINGNVYGLVQGDRGQAVIGSHPAGQAPFMAPMLPPNGVFGRDDLLTQIYNLLALEQEVAELAPVSLYGLGGIGKTTLAAAIGRLPFMTERYPGGVLWTALGPNPTIRLLLESWGRTLGVDLLPERDEAACRDRLRAVLYQRRALLIVDDVWEVAHGQFFMLAGPHCRTLITTRESPVAYAFATRERSLRVNVLQPEAALALLRGHAPDAVSLDEQTARRLCGRLEFLPLALTLAGRMLANEADVPTRMRRLVTELIERRDARLKLIQEEGRPGLGEDQPVSLQAILGMSVDRLSQIDRQRFAMLSVFGGEPMTWEIKAAAYVWDCPLEEAEDTTSHFAQRGLVERRGGRYWMHALLADYAAELLDEMKL